MQGLSLACACRIAHVLLADHACAHNLITATPSFCNASPACLLPCRPDMYCGARQVAGNTHYARGCQLGDLQGRLCASFTGVDRA